MPALTALPALEGGLARRMSDCRSRSGNRSFRFGVMEGPELVSATATLTGPVTSGQRGRPFSLPLTDLGSVGYVAEEFFLEGTASGYEAESGTELSVDGKWRVLASRTAPFRTRMLVVRPVTMARFNGVVYVNWQNVTAGFELGTADFESEQLLDGFAWVGVSAQRVGVYGFPGSEQFALRGWDPERYGMLEHPGDDFSFDIYTQATRAIGPAILGGAKAHKLVATGASQSAMRLRTYANAVQPIECQHRPSEIAAALVCGMADKGSVQRPGYPPPVGYHCGGTARKNQTSSTSGIR